MAQNRDINQSRDVVIRDEESGNSGAKEIKKHDPEAPVSTQAFWLLIWMAK